MIIYALARLRHIRKRRLYFVNLAQHRCARRRADATLLPSIFQASAMHSSTRPNLTLEKKSAFLPTECPSAMNYPISKNLMSPNSSIDNADIPLSSTRYSDTSSRTSQCEHKSPKRLTNVFHSVPSCMKNKKNKKIVLHMPQPDIRSKKYLEPYYQTGLSTAESTPETYSSSSSESDETYIRTGLLFSSTHNEVWSRLAGNESDVEPNKSMDKPTEYKFPAVESKTLNMKSSNAVVKSLKKTLFYSHFSKLTCLLTSIEFLIKARLAILTLYFCLNYCLLPYWASSTFSTPPPTPAVSSILSPLTFDTSHDRAEREHQHTLIQSFLTLIHPHIDSSKHLNSSFDNFMKQSFQYIILEWIFLFSLLSKHISQRTQTALYCIIEVFILFMHFTGSIWGGLNSKAVLYPDIWDFVHQQIHFNEFGGTRLQYLEATLKFDSSGLIASLGDFFKKILYCDFIIVSLRYLCKSALYGIDSVLSLNSLLLISSLVLMYMLDCLALLINCIGLICNTKIRHVLLPTILFIGFLSLSSSHLGSLPKPTAHDHHYIDFRPHLGKDLVYPGNTTFTTIDGTVIPQPPVYLTKYVPMHDAVEIAVDIYLPPQILYDFIIDNFDNPIYALHYLQSFGLHPYSYKHLMKEAERGIRLMKNNPTYKYTRKSKSTRSKKFKKIPTLFVLTRYNRRMTLKWPFTLLSLWGQPAGQSTANVWTWQFVESVVPNSYAVVVADSRGTGASFGNRPVDFSMDEITDFQTLHDWISKQFWHNGKMAVGGFSYDGMAGLHLASLQNVQAVLALFTPINVVNDLIQPGGLVCSSFVEDYTKLTSAFEKSGTPRPYMLEKLSFDWHLTLGFVLTFGVVAPVKFREGDVVEAIKEHQSNWNMSHMVEKVHFSDDFIVIGSQHGEATQIPAYESGITRNMVKAISESEAAVYMVGGFCDSSSVRGVVRLFDELGLHTTSKRHHIKHELILGPWTHTGRQNCSPYAKGTESHFENEMYWDIVRFLDCHVQNRCWGQTETTAAPHGAYRDEDQEPFRQIVLPFESYSIPLHQSIENSIQDCSNTKKKAESKRRQVHFWSIGEERWISSESFPPGMVEEYDLVFSNEPIQYPRVPLMDTRQSYKKNLSWYQILEKVHITIRTYMARQDSFFHTLKRNVDITQIKDRHTLYTGTKCDYSNNVLRSAVLQQFMTEKLDRQFSFSTQVREKNFSVPKALTIIKSFNLQVKNIVQTILNEAISPFRRLSTNLDDSPIRMRDSYHMKSRSHQMDKAFFDIKHSSYLLAQEKFMNIDETYSNFADKNLIQYEVDYNAATQGLSRWLIAKHPFRMISSSTRELFPLEQRIFVSEESTNTDKKKASSKDGHENTYKLYYNNNRPMQSDTTIFTSMSKSVFGKIHSSLHKFFSPTATESQTGHHLLFSTLPLQKPLRIAGSPLIRLSLNMTGEFEQYARNLQEKYLNQRDIRVNEFVPIPAFDITLFAYLEDIDLTTNNIHYVTEGRILLSHRPTMSMLSRSEGYSYTSQGTNESNAFFGTTGLTDWSECSIPPRIRFHNEQSPVLNKDKSKSSPFSNILLQEPRIGSADRVHQSGERSSHHFTFGGLECIVFTLEPIAWYFKAGHIIRLSMSGSDRSSFQWSQTQVKEDADLFHRSLMSTLKMNYESLRTGVDLAKRDIHVQQPLTWKIPTNNQHHEAFLKLPVLQ